MILELPIRQGHRLLLLLLILEVVFLT